MPLSLAAAATALPQYEAILPESGIRVEYRPFLVKEEKILYMAAETKNQQTIYNAVRDVILSCTDNKIDVMELSIPDTEYLFLQLRIHSVGDEVKPMIKCMNEGCGTPNEVLIKLSDIKSTSSSDKKPSKEIELSKNLKVVMKYPSTIDAMSLPENISDMDKALTMVAKCIQKVYIKDEIFDTKEMPLIDIIDFIETLTQAQFKNLFTFIDTMPKMQYPVRFKCRKCGHENDLKLEGMASFF
jgi:hypothetical protein